MQSVRTLFALYESEAYLKTISECVLRGSPGLPVPESQEQC